DLELVFDGLDGSANHRLELWLMRDRGLPCRRLDPREPKVRDANPTVTADQDVARLHVTVQQPGLVNGCEPAPRREHDRDDRRPGPGPGLRSQGDGRLRAGLRVALGVALAPGPGPAP